MKKLATLMLAAGMVLGSFAGAQAIDWKVKGEWLFEFGYTSGMALAQNTRGGDFNTRSKNLYGAGWNSNGGNSDNFQAMQRVRLQIDAVASESLSGEVFLEIGSTQWGSAGSAPGRRNSGGSIGQRGVEVGVRRAFIDWMVPNSDINVRMGIQNVALPSFTFGSGVFADDTAAVVATWKFSDNVSAVAFWARPVNENYAPTAANAVNNPNNDSRYFMDNVDVGGLIIPLSFDGFKVTPWGVIGGIGPNALKGDGSGPSSFQGDASNGATYMADGLLPKYTATNSRYGRGKNSINNFLSANQYATAWWAGLTGEITAAEPFRFAWDANYGSISYVDTTYLNRSGWFLNVLAEYKLDWGVPGIYAWWGSGDTGDIKQGSQRMPVVSIRNTDMMLSTFGYNGSISQANYDGSTFGTNYTGTWGIGARIRDISFIEDLKHTIRVNIMGGTNAPIMAKYITGKKIPNAASYGSTSSDFNGSLNTTNGSGGGMYLTSQDYAMEVNFDTVYKIYENLELLVELGYIHLWLDQSRSMWGSAPQGAYAGKPQGIRGVSTTDAFKAVMMFRYVF